MFLVYTVGSTKVDSVGTVVPNVSLELHTPHAGSNTSRYSFLGALRSCPDHGSCNIVVETFGTYFSQCECKLFSEFVKKYHTVTFQAIDNC